MAYIGAYLEKIATTRVKRKHPYLPVDMWARDVKLESDLTGGRDTVRTRP